MGSAKAPRPQSASVRAVNVRARCPACWLSAVKLNHRMHIVDRGISSDVEGGVDGRGGFAAPEGVRMPGVVMTGIVHHQMGGLLGRVTDSRALWALPSKNA